MPDHLYLTKCDKDRRKESTTQAVTSHTDSIILKLWKTRNKETAIAPS